MALRVKAARETVLEEYRHSDTFTEFVREREPRLKVALCAAYGEDLGMEATAEALAFAWEHWERVSGKANPAGYIFGVGRDAPVSDGGSHDSWARLPVSDSSTGTQMRACRSTLGSSSSRSRR